MPLYQFKWKNISINYINLYFYNTFVQYNMLSIMSILSKSIILGQYKRKFIVCLFSVLVTVGPQLVLIVKPDFNLRFYFLFILVLL